MQQQTAEPQTRKEHVFDEQGNTVETVEVIEEGATSAQEVSAEGGQTAAAAPKFRIGDREFATQDEALAFAQSEVSTLQTETQVADAYRQGIRDAMAQNTAGAPGVTPAVESAASVINTEEFYTNPAAFLDRYAQKIKSETFTELNNANSLKAQSDQIWREFTDRHPEMAEFRTEVENFVQADTSTVRGIISTKGRPASYDYIATKLKSRFETYSNALKPKRELPNTTAGASPSQKAAGVTPKEPPKKALSFAEQVRSIRKRR